MTYFLQGEDPPQIKAHNPDVDMTTWMGGLGAAWEKSAIENDANFMVARKQRDVQFGMAEQAASRIGIKALNDWYTENGAGYDHLRPAPSTTDEFFAMHGNDGYRMVLDAARKQAETDPSKWSDMDLSDKAVEAQVNERLKAEYDDAQQALDMMPGGRGAAEFLGALGGFTADIKNIPFLLLGGGEGSLLRVMGREAAINMGAEAAFLPDQFDMAQRLGIADPDVKTQLAFAAVGGAVFGGLTEGGSRALTYWKGRNARASVPGYDAATSDAMVSAAENALASGENPLQAVQKAVKDTRPQPYILENPINPERPPLITTERLPGVDGQSPTPLPDATIAAQANAAISEAEKARASLPKKPFTQRLKQVKIDPDGPLAAELKAADITARSAPGLFKRGGAKDLDNLVASEWEQYIPGISSVTGVDGHYLSRQGVVDAISAELSGKRLPIFDEMAVRAREADAAAASRTPSEDFIAGKQAENGFFVDLNEYHFDQDRLVANEQIARDFHAFLDDRYAGVRFTDAEKAEMLSELQTRGGDAEYLVERMAERELDYAALPPQEADYGDIPFGEDAGAAQGSMGPGDGTRLGARSDAQAEGGGAAGTGNARGPVQGSIPGTDRIDTGISQRAKSEMAARQQQSKIRRLDQTRIEDTEGTLFGGAQGDMFSEPWSKQSRPLLDEMTASIRDDIEKNGDSMIDMGDGKGERSLSSVLDELDRMDDFADILDLCGKPMVKA